MNSRNLKRWWSLTWGLGREVGWTALVALCAALALNWHYLALTPPDMNPVQLQRLTWVWLAVLACASWPCERKLPGSAAWIALLLASAALFPADLWPLAVAGTLIAALLFDARARWWRALALLLALGIGTSSLLSVYERNFGRVTAESLSTIFQTHPAEALEYIAHLVTPGWLVNLTVWSLLLGLVAGARRRVPGPLRPAVMAWAVAVATLAAVAASPGILTRALALKQGLADHRQRMLTIDTQMSVPARWARPVPLDVVWVVGESQSRWHWSLYGYPRSTTPQMTAMQDELVVMRDAVAPHSYTVQSLMEATYRPLRGASGQPVQSVSSVALLRSAGVAVHWHSAQEKYGPWATPLTALASRSNSVEFHGSHMRLPWLNAASQTHPDVQTQTAVLARLASEPAASGPRMLVHHMYAAHDPYCAHKPLTPEPQSQDSTDSALAWFGAAPDRSANLRCYEQAVRFTDELLAGYVQMAAKLQRPTVVLFVPDHGEAPEEGSGHNADRASARHLEIPVLAYFNAAARQALPEHWNNLRQHQSHRFMGNWVFELLVDLFGVVAPDVRLAPSSPSAANYAPPERIIYPKGRRWNYDSLQDASKLDVLSSTRKALARKPGDGRRAPLLYAHRCNSVLKAIEAARYFDGIELDIVLDEGSRSVLVNHPPMAVSGLTLGAMMRALSFKPQLQFWLDFKNPGATPPELGLALLGELDQRFSLKARSLLEMPADTPAAVLQAYAVAGWRTSIYVPEKLATCVGPSGDATACNRQASDLVALARQVKASALSFDDALRSAVDQYVRPQAQGLQLMSWKLSLKSDDPRLVDMAADLQPLDGLIVSFPSSFSP